MFDTIQRRQKIVEEIQQQGQVRVEALSKRFAVSSVTIRGDLNELDRRGLLVRSRGGAVASTPLAKELSMNDRYRQNLTLKQKIGKLAAGLIGNGERVILDSGSTAEEVARHLHKHQNLQVMTSGLNVATRLAEIDAVALMLCGGNLRHKTQSFYGPLAEASLKNLRFDKFILGVDGFDLEAITTHFEPEACLNRLMCDAADEVIAVADSSKFGRKGLHLICQLSRLNAVVTDSALPEDYVVRLAQADVTVHLIDAGPDQF